MESAACRSQQSLFSALRELAVSGFGLFFSSLQICKLVTADREKGTCSKKIIKTWGVFVWGCEHTPALYWTGGVFFSQVAMNSYV